MDAVQEFRELAIPKEAEALANEGDFEIEGYEITAQDEQLRQPRKVRRLRTSHRRLLASLLHSGRRSGKR